MNNLAAITAKRDELLAERKRLHDQRQTLLTQQRRVDRELADCRGAARFFGLSLDFPEEGDPIGALGQQAKHT
jgi:hypothetical protein